MISKIFSFFLICFLTISKGQAMSILDAGKVCTFSAVKATVTYKGEPVKEAKVTRLTEWKKEEVETTTTNDLGYFEFPAKFERSITTIIPIEFVSMEVLTVEHLGKEQEIWITAKRKKEENSELGGKPLILECELTNELKIYRDFGPALETNCTWLKDKEFDK